MPIDVISELDFKLEIHGVKEKEFKCLEGIKAWIDGLLAQGECHVVKEGPKGREYVYSLLPWSSLEYPSKLRLLVSH